MLRLYILQYFLQVSGLSATCCISQDFAGFPIKVFSLLLVFSSLTMIFPGVLFFGFILIGVYSASKPMFPHKSCKMFGRYFFKYIFLPYFHSFSLLDLQLHLLIHVILFHRTLRLCSFSSLPYPQIGQF